MTIMIGHVSKWAWSGRNEKKKVEEEKNEEKKNEIHQPKTVETRAHPPIMQACVCVHTILSIISFHLKQLTPMLTYSERCCPFGHGSIWSQFDGYGHCHCATIENSSSCVQRPLEINRISFTFSSVLFYSSVLVHFMLALVVQINFLFWLCSCVSVSDTKKTTTKHRFHHIRALAQAQQFNEFWHK